VDDEKEVRGDVVNGSDRVTWFRNLNETWNGGHTFSERHGPTYDSEATTDAENIHYRYWAEGSPASGTRRVLREGVYRTSSWYQPQVGTRQETNTSSPAGSGVEQVTQWPMQGGWTDNTMVVGVWQLSQEGAAWVWDNGGELLRIGFGLVDVGLGVAYTVGTGGVGGVLGGVVLMGVGVDQIITGVWNIRRGRVGHGFSALEGAVYDATGSETAAFLAPMVASLGAATVTRLSRIAPAVGSPLGARGPASGREFDADLAGGPVRQLTTADIRITTRGINVVEQHLARFVPDAANRAMIQRLRDILAGRLQLTQADINFYSHELREFVRYRRLGWRADVPTDIDARHALWNNTHTASLEDYRLRGLIGDLYHSDLFRLMIGE